MRTETNTPRNKLRRCAASIAIGAALGIVAAAPMAAIVDSGTISINVPNTFAGIYVNLATGASAITPAGAPGWDFGPWSSSGLLSFFWNGTPASSNGGVASTTTGPYLDLAPGAVVSSASTFSVVTSSGATAAFRTTGQKIVGFRFFNEGTAAINYGYALLTTTAASGFPATITRIFFENTGAAITVTGGAPPVFVLASSRKIQGGGAYDLVLSPVIANTTVEPRQGPNHTIVFQFNNIIVSATAAVTEGTATAGPATPNGNQVSVALTGVTNQQYVTVTLTNVTDSLGGTGGTATARLGLLTGDVNQNRVVTLTDVGLVNGQLSQVVSNGNYLMDVNASGTLTLTDKGIANSSLTNALPPP